MFGIFKGDDLTALTTLRSEYAKMGLHMSYTKLLIYLVHNELRRLLENNIK